MNYFPVGKGGKIKVDGEEISLDKIELLCYSSMDEELLNFSYAYSWVTPAVLNDELYVMCYKYSDTSRKDFYKLQGGAWVTKSHTPYYYDQGAMVEYNNELHLLGGPSVEREHYKFDGNLWTKLDDIPFSFYRGSCVVYDGEIHLLKAYNHYKWNPTDGWVNVSTLPYSFNCGGAVVYNGEIHILGGNTSSDTDCWSANHYKWNPTDGWVNVGNMPFKFGYPDIYSTNTNSVAVVLDGEIHLLGRIYVNSSSSNTSHYKWNPTDGWVNVGNMPRAIAGAVVFCNGIHIFGDNKQYRLNVKRYAITQKK